MNKWYGYSLTIFKTYTLYELLDSHENILEELVIDHRDCGSSYLSGSKLRLYFGGQCPAPQDISVCYKD